MSSVMPFYRAMAHVDDTSYILSDTFQILRVNPAWTRFAENNNGATMLSHWGRGSHVLDAISGDLRAQFRELFETSLASNVRIEHDYDCSSPTAIRSFRMFAVPLDGKFLVVTHAQRIEGDARTVIEESYERDGIIVMCAGCRRVRAHNEAEQWDWVAGQLDTFFDKISHGFCSLCATLALRGS